jgi:hypothetical protein
MIQDIIDVIYVNLKALQGILFFSLQNFSINNFH